MRGYVELLCALNFPGPASVALWRVSRRALMAKGDLRCAIGLVEIEQVPNQVKSVAHGQSIPPSLAEGDKRTKTESSGQKKDGGRRRRRDLQVMEP